jgi:hypothetical protein
MQGTFEDCPAVSFDVLSKLPLAVNMVVRLPWGGYGIVGQAERVVDEHGQVAYLAEVQPLVLGRPSMADSFECADSAAAKPDFD